MPDIPRVWGHSHIPDINNPELFVGAGFSPFSTLRGLGGPVC